MKELTKEQKSQENCYNYPYHYLDLKCDEYKLINHIEYISYLKKVKELLKPYKGQKILDAGCGDGRFCYEMKNENITIEGIDYSKRAITFAQAFNPELKLMNKNLENIKLEYKYDSIVLIETLEHIVPEKIPTIINNLHELLNPKGKIIVTVPTKNMELPDKHYQHFTEENIKKIMNKKFRIIKIYGHSKKESYRLKYNYLIKLGKLIYPLRNKKHVKNYYKYLNKYYQNNLEFGNPKECNRLIIKFEKI